MLPPRHFTALRWPLVASALMAAAVGIGAAAIWLNGAALKQPFDASRPLKILVSGDTQGWITPCGCASNQSGGLLRRGTFVRQQRERHEVVLLDAGGAAGGTSAYDRAKFEAILDGQLLMGLAAHNLGESELALGPDVLRQIASGKGVPFLSANATDKEGKLIADPFRVISTGEKRIAVIGVVSPRYATDECRVADPQAAVLKAREAIVGKYDWLVVLAYLPEDELRAVATALPEADALIGGPTGQSIAPVKVGPVLLASATNKGKFLLALQPLHQAGGWHGEVVEMTPELDDDHVQVTNLSRYRQVLESRDFTAAESGLASPLSSLVLLDSEVAGTAACRDCHASEFAFWEESGHARAWQTLAAQGAHVDSYCQQCHTTGFGWAGGFVSARRSLGRVGVGCESCHGPAQSHAQDPTKRTAFVAGDTCIRCHDRENSPHFDYATYWPMIAHGKRQE